MNPFYLSDKIPLHPVQPIAQDVPNKPADLWTYRYEESGGYDCITPAVEILYNGQRSFVIDAKDHGWHAYGLGSDVAKHRTDASQKIITLAQGVVMSLNWMNVSG